MIVLLAHLCTFYIVIPIMKHHAPYENKKEKFFTELTLIKCTLYLVTLRPANTYYTRVIDHCFDLSSPRTHEVLF